MSKVIVQNTQRVAPYDGLFRAKVLIGDKAEVDAMLDSGSMACSLSYEVLQRLSQDGAIRNPSLTPTDVVLIGCGGSRTKPLGVCDLEMKLFGHSVVVPTLVVATQSDDLIVGSNLLKYLIQHLRILRDVLSHMPPSERSEVEQHKLLSLLANVEVWSGSDIPDKVGTVKIKKAVTLDPLSEHLVWGQLQKVGDISVGSAVIMEPTSARSRPKSVLVGRTVAVLRGDGWLPMKVINPSDKPVTLRRNAKLVDVFPCVELEDFDCPDMYDKARCVLHQQVQKAGDVVSDSGKDSHLTSEDSSVPDSHGRDGDPSGPRGEPTSLLHDLGLADIDVDSCNVSSACKEKLVQLLAQYQSIFSRHKLDCGKATGYVHRIRLSDERPFRLPYRRVAPNQYEKLRQVLNEMEERDIIRKSSSDFASPLVLVWKKSGDLRLCTDFRWINARTIKDAHPLPHQADALAALGGNTFFSTMDLTSGYYNIEVHEDDKRYTAFTSPFGLYEYNRLPQGLCNSPATFMRMMLTIFGDQNFLSLLCYLDDILVFAPTEDLALERLEMVFERLQAHNLKLAPKKCHFLRRSVKFLGHIVSAEGIATDPEKVRAITALSEADLMEDGTGIPSQQKIRSFLGMVVFYQQFIEGFSSIAKPLFGLTAGPKAPLQKRKKCRPPHRTLTAADWTEECKQAFHLLKQALLDQVVLAHPNFSEPFLLSVDASSNGLGAVLSQVPEGGTVARPIAFASKSLSFAQSRYPAHRLEFFAMKWAVCDKFHHWLRGHPFTVWTDNNPLTYILSKAKLDACEQRWIAKLAPYQFDIKYIPGPKNIVADALSREPFAHPSALHRLTRTAYEPLLAEADAVCTDQVQDVFRWSTHPLEWNSAVEPTANCQCAAVVQPGSLSCQEVAAVFQSHKLEGCAVTPQALLLPQLPQAVFPEELAENEMLSHDQLMEKQRADTIMSRVIFFVERGRQPSRRERALEPAEVLRLLKSWDKLLMQKGVLYRVSKSPVTKKKSYLYVVPASLKAVVLEGVHDEAGHQGQQRTLYLARQRFYWSGLEKDVRGHVKSCKRCVLSKTPEPEARAPLENIVTTEPLELVCLDFWCAEDSKNRSLDVLVVTDHFTKMANAFLCPNQSAKAVAHQLWHNFFCVYGFPKRIHSDRGANFESALVADLLRIAGVQKSHTTPYHPMGNGSCERMNRTLGNMIRALPPRAKHRWPQALKSLTFAYNCTIHETTGYAPFLLMFGRIPRLPIDMAFSTVLDIPEVVCYDEYVQSLRRCLKEAMGIARASASKQLKRHTELYNRKVRGAPVDVGDRVLLANKGERGKRKLADRWEDAVYLVVGVNANSHTFKIQHGTTGVVKVVHRNLITPVNFLPLPDTASEEGQDFSVSSASECPCPEPDDAVMDEDDTSTDAVEYRTKVWVSQLPSEGSSVLSVEVAQHTPPSSSSGQDGPLPSPVSVGLRPQDLQQPVSELGGVETDQGERSNTALADVAAFSDQIPSLPVAAAPVPSVEPSASMRSRTGRLLRPVTRLIEMMDQKIKAL